MLIRWKIEKFVIPLIAAGLIIYISYQPKFRLRSDMPPAFVVVPVTPATQKPVPDKQMAGAYWACAVTKIQWRYSRAYLPPSPPPEFDVTSDDSGTPNDPAVRMRYWSKLQEVWYLPDTWTKSYEWDFRWLKDPLASLRMRFSNYIGSLSDLI